MRRKHEPVTAFYDTGCRVCRRTVAILKAIDLLDVLDLRPIADAALTQPTGLPLAALDADLHVIEGTRVFAGYDAYSCIARRLLLLWPVSVVMRLPPVAAVGRRVYRSVADSRHCAVPSKAPRQPATDGRCRWLTPTALALICGQLAASSLMFLVNETPGFVGRLPKTPQRAIWAMAGAQPRWPFDCYPTFAYPTPDVVDIWEVRWVRGSDESRATPAAYASAFGASAISWSIVTRTGQETDKSRLRGLSSSLTRALWNAESSDARRGVSAARTYVVRYRLGPWDPPAVVLNETPIDSVAVATLAR
jgi:predicted DCC family thiol-disulfide oxidoreductase YuxK